MTPERRKAIWAIYGELLQEASLIYNCIYSIKTYTHVDIKTSLVGLCPGLDKSMKHQTSKFVLNPR